MKKQMLIMLALLLAVFLPFHSKCVAQSLDAGVPQGIVAWWPADGDPKDLTGTNNGMLEGGTSFLPGMVGQAFSFDGVDDYVDYGADASLNWATGSSFTYEFWLKTTAAYGVIISQRSWNPSPVVNIAIGYGGYTLFGGGQVVALIRDDTDPTWAGGCITQCTEVNSTISVNDGNFHHVAVVRDAAEGQIKIYIDGSFSNAGVDKLQTGITTDLRAIGTELFWVAINFAPGKTFFNGIIDEVRIYNRALSQAEIQELYTGVAAPLKNENSLIMTTSENFAEKELYFDDLKINHSGVDLALSFDGEATASSVTANKTAYSICDGTVEFSYPKGGVNSFIKVHHPNCNGYDVMAYYGHINPTASGTISKGDPIGSVICQESTKNGPVLCRNDMPGNNSHVHLTIDTQIQRNLRSYNYEMCDYILDDLTQTISSLTNCSLSNRNAKLPANKILLRIGWGQVAAERYTDNSGSSPKKPQPLYITEPAMRQLGFISFFDLYQP